MDDLIAFLAARLDEDEARSWAAAEEWDDEDARYEWEDLPDASFAHARSYNPARVLREVGAKRKIIEIHKAAVAAGSNDPAIDYSIRMVLRSYATVWSDHPAYRQEWKP